MLKAPPITEQSVDLSEQIRHPHLDRLYRYWNERRGRRALPARRDIDPLDFSYLLGNIILVDVLREPLRFRVRLHGDALAIRAGYDFTGKFLDQPPISDYRAYAIERCKGIVETGRPLAVEHNRVLDGRPHHYEALWLPLSDDGENVNKLLCALIYRRDAG
jgi:hypothetical protein